MKRAHRRAHLLLWLGLSLATAAAVLLGPRYAPPPASTSEAPPGVFSEPP